MMQIGIKDLINIYSKMPEQVLLERTKELQEILPKVFQDIHEGRIVIHHQDVSFFEHVQIIKRAFEKEDANSLSRDAVVQQIKAINDEFKEKFEEYKKKAEKIAFKIVVLAEDTLLFHATEENFRMIFSTFCANCTEDEKAFIEEKIGSITTRIEEIAIDKSLKMNISLFLTTEKLLKNARAFNHSQQIALYQSHVNSFENKVQEYRVKKQSIEKDYFWDELQRQRAIFGVKSFLKMPLEEPLKENGIKYLSQINYGCNDELKEYMLCLFPYSDYWESEDFITRASAESLYEILLEKREDV